MKKVVQIGLLVLCVGLMPKSAQAVVNNNTNYASTSETIKTTALTPEQEFEQLKEFLESKDIEGKTNAEKIGLKEGTTGTKLGDYNDIIVDEDGYIVKIYWGMKDLIGDLNVSNFSKLKELHCFINQLTNLNANNLTALTVLNCFTNQLTSLDVNNLTALTVLNCDENQLTSLDVSNLTALTSLSCWNNQLTSLDVSNLTALTSLDCPYNQLTSLDVSNLTALISLDCPYNQLTSLDVSNLTALTELNCGENQLTSLDMDKLTALTELNCGENQLINLDISNLTALTELYCDGNELISLDVSNLTALTFLNCGGNQLTNLDVSNLTALTFLKCDANQLTSLDVSKLTDLTLNCKYNQLTMNEIKKIEASIPIISINLHYSPQNILGKRLDDSKYYIAPKGDIKSLGTDSSTYKWSDGTTGSNYNFNDKVGANISCTITDGDIILETNSAIILEQTKLEEAITKSKIFNILKILTSI